MMRFTSRDLFDLGCKLLLVAVGIGWWVFLAVVIVHFVRKFW